MGFSIWQTDRRQGGSRGDHAAAGKSLEGSADSTTYPVIKGGALKVAGCVVEQQHEKQNDDCRCKPGDESHASERRRRRQVPSG